GRHRSVDLALFRRALYQLSYPTLAFEMSTGCGAVLTGFEPATSGLTGRRALQTAPQDQIVAPQQLPDPTRSSGGRPTGFGARFWPPKRSESVVITAEIARQIAGHRRARARRNSAASLRWVTMGKR